MVWLPTGAALVEIDAAAHSKHARQDYQRLARAAGLVPFKLWLDGPTGGGVLEDDGTGSAAPLTEGRWDGRSASEAAAIWNRRGEVNVQPCTHKYPNGTPVLGLDWGAIRAVGNYDASHSFNYSYPVKVTSSVMSAIVRMAAERETKSECTVTRVSKA